MPVRTKIASARTVNQKSIPSPPFWNNDSTDESASTVAMTQVRMARSALQIQVQRAFVSKHTAPSTQPISE